MKRILAALALVASACSPQTAPAPVAESAPVEAPAPADPNATQVMVLGTYHFGNPGRDLHNVKIDPVTTPEKQAELEEVAAALAKFQPTAIAVERIAKDPATMLDQRYSEFKPEHLATDPDERVQVGYRLAARQKLDRVYAIDEQEGPGEPSYFPYDAVAAWAEKNGRAAELAEAGAGIQAEMAKMEADQKTHTIGQMLAYINAPGSPLGPDGHAIYMKMLTFGAGEDQPGAELNGRWYTRNAIIFAKLAQVAKPGDRIVVIYGAGHSYWLRQLVKAAPGYRLVEASAYLPEAAP